MDKSRREFLKGTAWMGVAAMAAGHLAAHAAENRPGCAAGAPMHGFRVAPMKRVRVGFIGVGARGTPAVKRIAQIPGCEVTAISDINPVRLDAVQKWMKENGYPAPKEWSRNGDQAKNHQALEESRGAFCKSDSNTAFPIGSIIARGFAVMSACYCEVSPDPIQHEPDPKYSQQTFAYTGVFDLWGKRDESRTDNITALGAWAWALSRGLDLAERIPELDTKKSVVTGCSRLGKAAFIAAARDERFAVCVPNQCGGGGVCVAKRDFGEVPGTEVVNFTHWYCKAYAKYAKNPPKLLTFDQHLLLASIAPRRVLVEGFGPNNWMDTEAEYIACKAASPAWEFLGLPGMPGNGYPDYYDTSCIGPYLGYVRRTEQHGIAAIDWMWMMDFARNAFEK